MTSPAAVTLRHAPLRILLVTPNFENNSLGRTYCLWLLARHLGWETSVIGVKGSVLWGPLRDSAFAEVCHNLTGTVGRERVTALRAWGAWSSAVIAVKPLPTSFGLGRQVARLVDRPLLLDIDDPDIEVRTTWRPAKERLPRMLLSRRYHNLLALRRLARQTPTIVSNPVLAEMYGGSVVPHVRPDVPAGGYSGATAPVIRFIGSPRLHKGIDVLRSSIAELAAEGYRLEVTADAPPDARPWETWLGATTLARGQELVASADAVALPSLPDGWSRAQLPVKLIDAMVLGRAIVASDLGPVRWALGGTGLLVPPDDTSALTAALRSMADPQVRQRLGFSAYRRAQAQFTVSAVAPCFEHEVRRLLHDA